jgi:hypothetical protein
MEKSSKFKSVEYSGQSAEFCQQLLVVLAVQAGAESTEERIFRQDESSGPRGPTAGSKALRRRQLRHVR